MNQDYEIHRLREDFIRFSQLHSWYKHLPLEGSPFYFYKRKGQQIRHRVDPMVDDEVGEHYHFVMGHCPDPSEKHCSVRFGPFLRGDGYGLELIGREERDKKRVKEWLKATYPYLYQRRQEILRVLEENIDKPYEELREVYKQRNQIDEEIFSLERERHWKDVLSAYQVSLL